MAWGSVITALNVAYEVKEKRGFIALNLLALASTGAAVVVAIVALIAIAAQGHLESLIPDATAAVLVLGKLLPYALLGCGGTAAAAALYRFGPSREKARWTWIAPGSLLAAIFWLLLNLGFGIYVGRFGNYNATYGALGAMVVMLTWLYLSSYVLVFGAELNAALQHRTAADTTAGATMPWGNGGAWAVDHVAGQGQDGEAAAATVTSDRYESRSPTSHTAGDTPSLPADCFAACVSARVRRRSSG